MLQWRTSGIKRRNDGWTHENLLVSVLGDDSCIPVFMVDSCSNDVIEMDEQTKFQKVMATIGSILSWVFTFIFIGIMMYGLIIMDDGGGIVILGGAVMLLVHSGLVYGDGDKSPWERWSDD